MAFIQLDIEKQIVPDNFLHKLTMQKMRELENDALQDMEFTAYVLNKFNSNSLLELFKKLHFFVNNFFSYVDDLDLGADEVLISPQKILEMRLGDCDDFSLFIKTVLSVFNVPSQYVLYSKDGKNFNHIAVETKTGIILDGTNNVFGIEPNGYKQKYKVLD